MRLFANPVPRIARRRLVDRAWQLYVSDGVEPTGLSGEISRSWRRTRELYGIDPAAKHPRRILPADELEARRERDPVLRLSRPILQEFAARLGLWDHVLAFFDGDGCMLSIEGAPPTVDHVAAIDFKPGASWAEDAAGTNGPGTALAERRPVEVFGSEHFVAAWHPWSCAAAPIFAPGGEAPVALVDITGPWEVQRPQALLMAAALARAVEERLRAAASVRDEVVRYAFRAAHGSGDALVAIDAAGTVLAVNDAAARGRLLSAGALPPAIKGALVRALSRPGAAAASAREIHLDDPAARHLVASAVTHEGAAIGAILRAPAHGRAKVPRQGPRPQATARYDFSRILGSSDALARAVALARTAACNTLPVVLHGESGTGKELLAHAIHAASARAAGPFVAVNCGSIPPDLVEAELFGYEAGTFTGGKREGNTGRFEDADGGTLFLDEVSELPGPAQTAMLRVLQEREVVRLGGSAPRPVDVRVIAATNKALEEEIQARRFRRDLYYRLNVLTVDVPPLRERREDVALLARQFLAAAEPEVGRRGLSLGADALEALLAHDWPGNVRELRNVILRAAATAPAAVIAADDLRLQRGAPAGPAVAPAPREVPRDAPPGGTLQSAVLESERAALGAALDEAGWNYARAAQQLGISRMTLYRKLARLGIDRRRRPS